MSQQPAGWYPDPYAATTGGERWWDGSQWLAQTRDPVATPPQSAEDQGAIARATGPGAKASWLRRVGASLLDSIPFILLSSLLVSFSGYPAALEKLSLELDGLTDQPELALQTVAEAVPGLIDTLLVPMLVTLIAQAIYLIGMHATTGQTIGKRIVGIKVVRAASPDQPPTFGAATVRWLAYQGGPVALGALPIVGLLVSVYSLVNQLWPLWDPQKQALHDKVAKTYVVRVR